MPQYNQLTQEQRYLISVHLQAKKAKTELARLLDINYATLYREIRRNSINGEYCYKSAQRFYNERRKKSKKPTVLTDEIKARVIEKLKLRWSPEQIAGRAKVDNEFTVAFQTIYNWIIKDKNTGGTIYKYLRRKRKRRKHKNKDTHLKDRVWIDDRPAEVEKRERLGDWEIDCIISTKDDSTVIVTAVDRVSRFICASMLESRESTKLAFRVCRMLKYKKVLTITSDNGTEFAAHKYMSQTLGADYYFAHPYHSWERGSSENANGLIRQYLPSGKPLKGKRRQLSKAVNAINNRPRKCLNYLTPKEYMERHA